MLPLVPFTVSELQIIVSLMEWLACELYRHLAVIRTHLLLSLRHALPLITDAWSCLARPEMLEVTTSQTLLHKQEESGHGSFHESVIPDSRDLLLLKAGQLGSSLICFLDLRNSMRLKPGVEGSLIRGLILLSLDFVGLARIVSMGV